jgi:2-phospho-L-lactate guanylyltransferase
MAVYAVVPVKRLSVSKRRLSAVLNPEERKLLTLAMLENVLAALKVSVVDQTVVVCNDSVVKNAADRCGVSYFSASGTGLNADIEEAIAWCVNKHASSVLVLPADIPLVSSTDIDVLVKLGYEKASLVLSPSQNGGTNALLQNPPNLIPACFGPKSFANHFTEACNKGLRIRMYYSLGIGLDVDSVDDLKQLVKNVQGKSKDFKDVFEPAKPESAAKHR